MDKLLLVDDEPDVQYSFRRIFSGQDLDLATASSGEEALKLLPRVQPDLVIMDIRLGGLTGLETLRRLRQTNAKLPVILMTAYGTTQMAIEAMKLGAYDYLLKPFDIPKLKQTVAEALQAARAMNQVVTCPPLLESEDYAASVIGRSPAMQEVFKLIGQLADSDATVLITGQSGTGKELIARAIYHHSRRKDQPFLAINCAAIPENLLESELFGHEKGAFTGAISQRIGKFEQGHRGTLFLDEIGDMTPATQTKILRVLQSGTFERVGGNQSVQVNVRVLAATNKPLEQAVASGQFREDLFYRLNVVRLHLPALRERPGDILLLADYFLKKYGGKKDERPRSLSAQARNTLEQHPWPGNVRQLENVIQRALVVAKGDVLLPSDLFPEASIPAPQSASQPGPTAPALAAPPTTPATRPGAESEPSNAAAQIQALFRWARQDHRRKVLATVERELVVQALLETQGNQVRAAQLLGITRATLRKRIEKYAIRQQVSVQ